MIISKYICDICNTEVQQGELSILNVNIAMSLMNPAFVIKKEVCPICALEFKSIVSDWIFTNKENQEGSEEGSEEGLEEGLEEDSEEQDITPEDVE